LDLRPDVGKADLTECFMNREPDLVRRMGMYAVRMALKRWAEEILKGAAANKTAHREHPQLPLPFSLQAIEIPGAFSFISMANKVRFVASYKVTGWQLLSHIQIQRENETAITKSRNDAERLYRAGREDFERDPNLQLAEVLRRLCEEEQGAA